MLYRSLLTQLMLFRVSMATVAQTCVWKDGSVATDYLPCTNSTATSGTCCLSGESCLGTGLCYGALGLVYRGACINTWGGDCLTYCDDISPNWANLLPCPYANSGSTDGPESWWCGADKTTACVASNESHFLTIVPGLATKILGATVAASVTITQTVTGSSSPTTTKSGAATTNDAPQSTSSVAASTSSNNGTAIGLGVGLGVLFIACAGAGIWAYRSYRRQKEQFEQLNASVTYQGQAPPPVFQPEYQPKMETSNYGHNYGVQEMHHTRSVNELETPAAELGDR